MRQLVPLRRGRGHQCNVGARHAKGDILIFLHADSTLPPAYDVHLHRLFTQQQQQQRRRTRTSDCFTISRSHNNNNDTDDGAPQWGTFQFRLGRAGDEGGGGGGGGCGCGVRNMGRRLVEMCVNARTRLFRMPYGDQGLIIRRSTFDALGGFAAMPFMEDFELVRRLRRRGPPAVVPLPVTTSARRWDSMGLLRVTAVNQLMVWGYVCGGAVQVDSS
jgi:hypothetical protein